MNTNTVYNLIDIGEDVWLDTLGEYIGYRITAIGADYVEVTFEPAYNRSDLVAPSSLQVYLEDLYVDVDSEGNSTLNFEL
jgi:hypothetical protein